MCVGIVCFETFPLALVFISERFIGIQKRRDRETERERNSALQVL